MLSRDDFVFTIGYDGPAAVVDGQAKRRYKGLSAGELADKGLFRAAYAAALRDGTLREGTLRDGGGEGAAGGVKRVEEAYRRALSDPAAELPPLERLFGVFPVEVSRSIEL